MPNDEIVLRLDRETAQAVYQVLYQLGEHFAVGGPIPALNDPSLPGFNQISDFMRRLNLALGGSGRIT